MFSAFQKQKKGANQQCYRSKNQIWSIHGANEITRMAPII